MSFAGDAHSLFYTNDGYGPNVILIHGLGASRYDWESLRPELVSAGYRALAVDLPGHGDSAKPPDPSFYTSDCFYEVLQDWINRLEIAPPYFLVAHSLGGYLSLRYAYKHPQDVAGMALIDPLYSLSQIHTLLRYFSRKPELGVKLLQNLPSNWIDATLGWDPVSVENISLTARLQMIVDIRRASPHILNIPRSLKDLTPLLEEIYIPVLVIWGDKDMTLKPASFPPMIEKLPRANGQLIRGSGHQPHIGAPKLVNQLILDFISKQYHGGSD